MPSIKLRTRSRTPVQLGRTSREKVGRSSQLANVGRRASCYCFAWRGLHRRGNAGIVWVRQPGDYATFNSNQPNYATIRDGTHQRAQAAAKMIVQALKERSPNTSTGSTSPKRPKGHVIH